MKYSYVTRPIIFIRGLLTANFGLHVIALPYFGVWNIKWSIMRSPVTFIIYFFTTSTKTTNLNKNYILSAFRKAYRNILLEIYFDLGQEDQRNLHFYCSDLIPGNVTDTIDILRCLEKAENISPEDLHFLKDAMRAIRRLDIAKKLTKFEIKRDLTLLLDLYVRKILGLDSVYCCSQAVKKVAGYLARLMETVRDRVDITKINLTVESSRDLRIALADFERELDCREQRFSWNEFTMLVVYAGEIIAIASTNEEQLETVIELCSTATDELFSRMTRLESWVSIISV